MQRQSHNTLILAKKYLIEGEFVFFANALVVEYIVFLLTVKPRYAIVTFSKRIFNQAMSDENSILEKVISTKEAQEIQAFDPLEVVNRLMSQLHEKEADILQRRFGLQEAETETLETIGKFYGVTRERIRQIENLSIKKIKALKDASQLLYNTEHVFTAIFSQCGGFLTEEKLFEKVFERDKNTLPHQRSVIFILGKLLAHKFVKHIPDEKTRYAWRLRTASIEFLHRVIDTFHIIITEHGNPLEFQHIHEKVKTTDVYKEHGEKLTEDVLDAYLHISKHIGMNPFGEYGLRNWGIIAPRRMHDKIYLILKKDGNPMHFTDIAKKITDIFCKKAYPPTVHNELILRKEYVLVGRGIYALQEWGYRPGVVADVIRDIVKEAGRPLSRDEVVEKVLEQRIVKRNTIHLALTNKKFFRKNADNKYEVIEEQQISEISE
ncbi:MAG: hypothetical protein A3B74_04810 [Candidatus Kerfeldbacteria bacterium RIFCSPHIGHO2_02_FULL_42_14]|uniref:RNA polymerase sigma-70 region 4 domain-containing protein n=1 Tax=Candidatus Kerfeldbacteria bacterium RIFCSPHIGHO2_02_FULL_42_14 TaxID=1798540 RepID=A0A1G2APV2_9BACT|nr:MAG: hypothetical protein A3B74_04810 [Candidatus Kerfeldbacteria bacterium RIFCSPHIGHO2_02_FULL_42_14]OGY81041.1 MAG: hypothetical protein A3E60_03530 [Candidatus Kerfeldbacteria bacterium RIFCSPHIGHO2_12_FULL_42_13]OGY84859.1 MAG: hypothetical protein A3I91_05175 [Candidatus Kerfeldbacteria bacterium RIFCSPLOWO2_02_FULL_42_19]OGY86772.1 MAG: hypothetical protein A3G01_02475 [Candidatus Kerfeldbacteria bacterium RIFCSPLOWO2_12_FULL_43_9]